MLLADKASQGNELIETMEAALELQKIPLANLSLEEVDQQKVIKSNMEALIDSLNDLVHLIEPEINKYAAKIHV